MVIEWRKVHAVAQAGRVHEATHRELRTGIPSPVALHRSPDRRRRGPGGAACHIQHRTTGVVPKSVGGVSYGWRMVDVIDLFAGCGGMTAGFSAAGDYQRVVSRVQPARRGDVCGELRGGGPHVLRRHRRDQQEADPASRRRDRRAALSRILQLGVAGHQRSAQSVVEGIPACGGGWRSRKSSSSRTSTAS